MSTEQTGEVPASGLASALASAQGEFAVPTKSATGAATASATYKYATLADLIEATRPALSKHLLACWHTVEPSGDKWLAVTAHLRHGPSGEEIESSIPIPFADGRAQSIGSALTYGRKYSYAALLALAAEDDDGADASAKPVESAPEPARKPAKTAPNPAPTNGAGRNRGKFDTLAGLLGQLGVSMGKDEESKRLRLFVVDAMLDLQPGSTASVKDLTDRALDELCDRLREMTPASMSVVLDAIKSRHAPTAPPADPDPFAADEEALDEQEGTLLDAPQAPAAMRH